MALSFDTPRTRVAELVEYLDAVGDTCFVIGGRRIYTDDLRELLAEKRRDQVSA